MTFQQGRFDDNLVEAARLLAIKAHGEQKYGEEPYEVHLAAVVAILHERFNDPELDASGWLHDVVEDTSTTLQELSEQFPQSTIAIVHAVSSEPGKNRKERNAATYPKIRANHRATIVKLADRLANVRNAKASESKLLAMYKKEYPEFREALYYAGTDIAPMWEELDSLLYVKPRKKKSA